MSRAAGLRQALRQIRQALEDLSEAKGALQDPADLAIWHELVPLAVLDDLEHRLGIQLAVVDDGKGTN